MWAAITARGSLVSETRRNAGDAGDARRGAHNPAPEVAKWAGHSVEVLTRIYAGCVVGLDDVWIARMSAGLRPDG